MGGKNPSLCAECFQLHLLACSQISKRGCLLETSQHNVSETLLNSQQNLTEMLDSNQRENSPDLLKGSWFFELYLANGKRKRIWSVRREEIDMMAECSLIEKWRCLG